MKRTKRRKNYEGPVVLRPAATVDSEALLPLWGGRFFRGKIGFIAGEPGLGKSQIAIFMAAAISAGGAWPPGNGNARRGDVVYISAEDGLADTILPRLQAAGANLKRVFLIESVKETMIGGCRPFNLVADVAKLDAILTSMKRPRLVIIDPVNACLASTQFQRFSANNVTDVRALLGQIEAIAKKHRVAVVCITHLTKARSGSNPLSRIVGSFAFTAAARSVHLVVHDQMDASKRIFLPAKNNLGADNNGLAFRIKTVELDDGTESSAVAWEKVGGGS